MSEVQYHRIASQFFNRPMLLTPQAAETIGAFLFSRIKAGPRATVANDGADGYEIFEARRREDGTLETQKPRASRFYATTPLDDMGQPLPYRRTPDGRAIISVIGETVNRGAWIGASSGLVSYEALKYQLSRAASDPKTAEIILDIESPGGEAVGAMEAAGVVRAAREKKPLTAVVNGIAASAAYALASGASRIVTIPSGISGSIGVVMMHLDYSKMLDDEGVKPTLIYAGAHKVDGNPFEAMPKSVRERYQNEVDSFYAQFIETVRLGRAHMSAEMIRATEARTYVGEAAIHARLADETGSLEDILSEPVRAAKAVIGLNMEKAKMAAEDNNASERIRATGGFANSGDEAKAARTVAAADRKTETVADLDAAYPALTAQIRVEAAVAERARILGIEEITVGGHEALVASLKADGKTTPDQAAAAILRAEKATRGARMQAIANVERHTGDVTAAPPSDPPSASSESKTKDDWSAEYDRDPKIRDEFLSKEAYVAFKKAEASGRVRLLRGKGAA